MAGESRDRDRNDVILMPRQQVFIKDMTKGNLSVHVGPIKVTLSESERLMAPDPKNPSRLREVLSQEEAILPYVDAAESDYIVLNNPTTSAESTLKPRMANDMVELSFGRKVNIPGPATFPLWPFQSVVVVPGHQLQMNQYLVVRVVNDQEALANWNKGIVKPVEGEKPNGLTKPMTLSIGQLLVIKGTEVSFYIPPTGLEVVKDGNGNYVRDAITLEQLEYCILINQNGEKRFEEGPQVVFPEATEEFVVENKSKKFKAIELTPISGLHIKVTAPYTSGDKEYKEGDELFITGKETPIYFPRAEHAIIKYGKKTKHYATAVPKGEGRYVLNRMTGEIRLVRGPEMLLPDPRTEVIVRRIVPEKKVQLWFPGNTEAVSINRTLAGNAALQGKTDYYETDVDMDSNDMESLSRGLIAAAASGPSQYLSRSSTSKFVGDEMTRSETYTPPRTVTLNTKYDGAVQICPWTGYAVLVVDKSGNRQVVVGPDTVLLEFDQEIASMELSTGKPKNTDKLHPTAYLRVLNNQVSDIISAMTADDIPVHIKTSYRVNFLPEYKDKWFDAENYVKLICDHIRSKLRNVIKQYGIQELSAKHIDLVRDAVLGTKADDKTHRPGMTFTENGAHIYDVEVLGLEIGDAGIAQQLLDAQRSTINDSLALAAQKRKLELSKEEENFNQQLAAIKAATQIQALDLRRKVLVEQAATEAEELSKNLKFAEAAKIVEAEKQKIEDVTAEAKVRRDALFTEQKLAKIKEELALRLQEEADHTKNIAERTKAITPDLIAALQRFADMSLAEKMADSMAPMALLGGKSVAEVLGTLLQGTGLEKLATGVALGAATPRVVKNISGNGSPKNRLEQKV